MTLLVVLIAFAVLFALSALLASLTRMSLTMKLLLLELY